MTESWEDLYKKQPDNVDYYQAPTGALYKESAYGPDSPALLLHADGSWHYSYATNSQILAYTKVKPQGL